MEETAEEDLVTTEELLDMIGDVDAIHRQLRKVEALEYKLKCSRTRYAILEKKYEQCHDHLRKVDIENFQLNSSNVTLEKHNLLIKEFDDLQANYHDLVNSSAIRYQTANQEIVKVTARCDVLEKENEKLRQSPKALKLAETPKQTRARTKRHKISDVPVQDEKRDEARQLADLQQTLDRDRSKITQLTASLKSLQEHNDKIEALNDQLQNQLLCSNSKNQKTIDALNEQLRDKDTQIMKLSREMGCAKEDVSLPMIFGEMLNSEVSEKDTPKNCELEKSQNSELEMSQNGVLEKSQNGELEKSQNSELEMSQNGVLEKSQNSELEMSQNGVLEKFQNGELEKSQNSELEMSQKVSELEKIIKIERDRVNELTNNLSSLQKEQQSEIKSLHIDLQNKMTEKDSKYQKTVDLLTGQLQSKDIELEKAVAQISDLQLQVNLSKEDDEFMNSSSTTSHEFVLSNCSELNESNKSVQVNLNDCSNDSIDPSTEEINSILKETTRMPELILPFASESDEELATTVSDTKPIEPQYNAISEDTVVKEHTFAVPQPVTSIKLKNSQLKMKRELCKKRKVLNTINGTLQMRRRTLLMTKRECALQNKELILSKKELVIVQNKVRRNRKILHILKYRTNLNKSNCEQGTQCSIEVQQVEELPTVSCPPLKTNETKLPTGTCTKTSRNKKKFSLQYLNERRAWYTDSLLSYPSGDTDVDSDSSARRRKFKSRQSVKQQVTSVSSDEEDITENKIMRKKKRRKPEIVDAKAGAEEDLNNATSDPIYAKVQGSVDSGYVRTDSGDESDVENKKTKQHVELRTKPHDQRNVQENPVGIKHWTRSLVKLFGTDSEPSSEPTMSSNTSRETKSKYLPRVNSETNCESSASDCLRGFKNGCYSALSKTAAVASLRTVKTKNPETTGNRLLNQFSSSEDRASCSSTKTELTQENPALHDGRQSLTCKVILGNPNSAKKCTPPCMQSSRKMILRSATKKTDAELEKPARDLSLRKLKMQRKTRKNLCSKMQQQIELTETTNDSEKDQQQHSGNNDDDSPPAVKNDGIVRNDRLKPHDSQELESGHVNQNSPVTTFDILKDLEMSSDDSVAKSPRRSSRIAVQIRNFGEKTILSSSTSDVGLGNTGSKELLGSHNEIQTSMDVPTDNTSTAPISIEQLNDEEPEVSSAKKTKESTEENPQRRECKRRIAFKNCSEQSKSKNRKVELNGLTTVQPTARKRVVHIVKKPTGNNTNKQTSFKRPNARRSKPLAEPDSLVTSSSSQNTSVSLDSIDFESPASPPAKSEELWNIVPPPIIPLEAEEIRIVCEPPVLSVKQNEKRLDFESHCALFDSQNNTPDVQTVLSPSVECNKPSDPMIAVPMEAQETSFDGECPASPSAGCGLDPKRASLEKQKSAIAVKNILQQLLHYNKSAGMAQAVTRALLNENPQVIAKSILEMVSQDIQDKIEIFNYRRAPLLTVTQQLMLGLLLELEEQGLRAVITNFLDLSERYILSLKEPSHVSPTARLHSAICKLKFDYRRMRLMLCKAVFFMGNIAVPYLYIVLCSWLELLPHNNGCLSGQDALEVRTLVQIIRLKECTEPAYNLHNFQVLLNKYYEYPFDREDSAALLESLFKCFMKTKQTEVRSASIASLMYLTVSLCGNLQKNLVFGQLDKLKQGVALAADSDEIRNIIYLVGIITFQYCKDKTVLLNVNANETWLQQFCADSYPDCINNTAQEVLRKFQEL